jgi:hypothetical protein
LDWFFHIRKGAHTRKLSPTSAAQAATSLTRVAATPLFLKPLPVSDRQLQPSRMLLETPKIV